MWHCRIISIKIFRCWIFFNIYLLTLQVFALFFSLLLACFFCVFCSWKYLCCFIEKSYVVFVIVRFDICTWCFSPFRFYFSVRQSNIYFSIDFLKFTVFLPLLFFLFLCVFLFVLLNKTFLKWIFSCFNQVCVITILYKIFYWLVEAVLIAYYK